MAQFFIIGEKKVRPGVYFRYENWGLPPVEGADDGKCAAVFKSDWGPLDKPVPIEDFEEIARIYGGGGESGTTALPFEQFKGGARLVFAQRLGTGGTAGTCMIKDSADADVLRLTLLYPGSRKFSLTIRPTLEYPDRSELLLLDGTEVLERYYFDTPADANGVKNLLDAVAANASKYFTLTPADGSANAPDTARALLTIDQNEITPGTDPEVTIAAYSAAFEALEAYKWNVLAIDTDDVAVQMMMQLYLNRIYQGGKFVMGVIGEAKTVPFETRLKHASAYNDYQIVYVGTGFVDIAGNLYEGWMAAARIAGLIAGTPSSESITHAAIKGAADMTEPLTNYLYEQAIKAGMLTFSRSAANTVWVEQGINSMVIAGAKEDEGWKKIKRVKVRFELFQRLNDTVEGLVGRINNNPDGRATVIQAGNGVCKAMISEGKLLAGAHVELDENNKPEGDSAWFNVFADDVDTLEKLYHTFKFRFAPADDELTA
jgi:hypothetical protein